MDFSTVKYIDKLEKQIEKQLDVERVIRSLI